MYAFRIKIGNIVADIQSNYSYLKRICEPYLSDEEAVCSILIDSAAVEAEYQINQAAIAQSDLPSVNTEDWFLEVYALLHKLMPLLPSYNMLFLHGSAIRYKGKAYIFIAPSGTGKSTHSRLWKERFGDEVTVINDDKPFLAFRDDKVYVCGTPWRGKHNIGLNMETQLGGICILGRGDKNEIIRLNSSDAVQEVIQQSNLHRYKDNALIALDLIDKLLNAVPVYRLFCTPSLDAVDVCAKGIVNNGP